MTTTIYWGIADNVLYLSSTQTTEASTLFEKPDNILLPSSWPWYTDRKNLTEVIIQNKINFNGSIINMFYECSNLTFLDLSNFDTSNVTSMNVLFYGCSSLTSLNLSNFDTSNVTDMSLMFLECNNLISLNLSNFNTANVTNMANMFDGCFKLTSLNLSNFDTSNVTNMSHMFNRCIDLTSLNISNFDTSNVTNMNSMFNNCYALTSLDLFSFDTSNVIDMGFMFSDCHNLRKIYVSPITWKTNNVSAEGYYIIFENCYTLIGEKGTVYDGGYNDLSRAIIDGTDGNPGYLSKRLPRIFIKV